MSPRPIATVFGTSGFVARYIVAKLTKSGYQVRAASRHPSRSRHLLPLGAIGQIERVYAPIEEVDEDKAAISGVELVLNSSTLGTATPSILVPKILPTPVRPPVLTA